MARRIPESLAEAIGHDAPCGLPATHDRLAQCHYWWHQMGRNYHEPEPFRWSLGAFLQAARSVTFMLQAEKDAFKGLSFYERWRSDETNRPVLNWINKARVETVHKNPLLPNSWLRMTCVDERGNPLYDPDDMEDDQDDRIGFSPFICTHRIVALTDRVAGLDEDHGHTIERHWEIDSMPGKELLEICSDAYGVLDVIVAEAHHSVGQGFTLAHKGNLVSKSAGRLPCMEDTTAYRIARFVPDKRGGSTWLDEPPSLHLDT